MACPVIVHSEMITPYGRGTGACWDALCAGRSAIAHAGGLARDGFITSNAALVPDLRETGRSRLFDILAPVLEAIGEHIPEDAALLLATTTGEIDLLELSVLDDAPESPDEANPNHLLRAVRERLGLQGPAAVVSAACASSSAALAQAVSMVSAGQSNAVLVIGCDAISEFVFAGFSTLMALSPERARPFDRRRDGLTLGEAAAAALIMTPDRARAEKRQIQGNILGWGMASDANHMTGPSRDGAGLSEAIKIALEKADRRPDQITSICAHGTGTVYNDAMEMKAFRNVFGKKNMPLYSVKGGTGHTMGTAGILETLIATASLHRDSIPPTVGTDEPDSDAAGWVSDRERKVPDNTCALTTNSGFGGVNCAIILGA